MKKTDTKLAIVALAVLLGGCGGEGAQGPAGSSCTVTDNGDGTQTISCDDGSSVTVSDGETGSDGDGALVRLDDEPAGANCESGGVAVHAGIDEDGDGVLDDEEIDTTEYVCGNAVSACDTLEGSFVVESSLDLAAFMVHGCTRITGNLYIADTMLTTLSGLDTLEVVDGAIVIEDNAQLVDLAGLANLSQAGFTSVVRNAALETLSLPSLTNADALLIQENDALTAIELPVLAALEGPLDIRNNPALPEISGIDALVSAEYLVFVDNNALVTVSGFDALETVTAEFAISFHPSLTSISGFGALQSVGTAFHVAFDPELTSVPDFAALQSVGGVLDFYGDPSLTALPPFAALTSAGSISLAALGVSDIDGFDAVATTTGPADDGFLYIYDNPQLADISGFGALTATGGDFGVLWNDALTDLTGLGALTTVGRDFQIEDNPAFPTCAAQDFAAALSIAGLTLISGNDDAAECP